MKKTYISPTAVIVKIQSTSQLLSGSDSLGLGTAGSANGAESRRRGIIFDDDDDE